MTEDKNIFIHHVYFWLAEPGNEEHKKQLIEGLKKLSSVTTIQKFYIGQPAGTSRMSSIRLILSPGVYFFQHCRPG